MTTVINMLARFNEVIKLINDNGTKQKDVALKMGANDASHLNKVMKGTKVLTLDFLEEFIRAFPDVNLNFIKYGYGPIFLSDKNDNPDRLQEPDLTLYSPKPNGERSNIQHQPKPIMVYDLDEQTGKGLTASTETLSFKGSQQCDFAIKVHGEAMRGAVCNGGDVAVRAIKDKHTIAYGHIYYIQTIDYDMVRYIRKSARTGYITLHAHNDAEFDDFDVAIDSLIQICLVRKILNDHS